MGFILGLALGSMSSGGAPPAAAILGQIPLRCLYAFQTGGADSYKSCRRTSILTEIYNGKCGTEERCRDEARLGLELEVAALTEIQDAAKKQAAK